MESEKQALGADSHNSFEYLLMTRSFLRQDACPEGTNPLDVNWLKDIVIVNFYS